MCVSVEENEGDDVNLFQQSAFCNLPIVDTGFEPRNFSALSSCGRLPFYIKRFFCRLLFFIDTILHMLQFTDVAYLAVIIVVVSLHVHEHTQHCQLSECHLILMFHVLMTGSTTVGPHPL